MIGDMVAPRRCITRFLVRAAAPSSPAALARSSPLRGGAGQHPPRSSGAWPGRAPEALGGGGGAMGAWARAAEAQELGTQRPRAPGGTSRQWGCPVPGPRRSMESAVTDFATPRKSSTCCRSRNLQGSGSPLKHRPDDVLHHGVFDRRCRQSPDDLTHECAICLVEQTNSSRHCVEACRHVGVHCNNIDFDFTPGFNAKPLVCNGPAGDRAIADAQEKPAPEGRLDDEELVLPALLD